MSINLKFFMAIDELVRRNMKRFETELLPLVQQCVADTKVPVSDVPLEGYYHETPELAEFLKNLRALQNNKSDIVTDNVRKLHDIYSNPVFGIAPGNYTAINQGIGVLTGGNQVVVQSVISPMHDALSIAIMNFTSANGCNWDIQGIMEQTENIELGINLVGLGVMVDRFYKKKYGLYNPVATTAAGETTVASRLAGRHLGIEEDSPDPEIEAKGFEVLKAYNKLFSSYPEGQGIIISTEKARVFNLVGTMGPYSLAKRCVRIAYDLISGEHYQWAIAFDPRFRSGFESDNGIDDEIDDEKDEYYSNLSVIDFRTRNLVTTQDITECDLKEDIINYVKSR